jgi:hypothetical protein
MHARQKIIDICNKVLSDQLSIIEASRKIVWLTHNEKLDERDEDLVVFQGIDSETDHLPIGDVRIFWNKTSLEAKDEEIKKYEEWAKSFGREVCENLIKKYK